MLWLQLIDDLLGWNDLYKQLKHAREKAAEATAAAAVQARVRGQLARQSTQELRLSIKAEEAAAAAVQSRVRGQLARQAMHAMQEQQVKADGAAAAVQARVRGQLARQSTRDLRQQIKADGAAAAVQARVRGQLVRQATQDLRAEIAEEQIKRSSRYESLLVQELTEELRKLKVEAEAAAAVQARVRGQLARQSTRDLRRSAKAEEVRSAALPPSLLLTLAPTPPPKLPQDVFLAAWRQVASCSIKWQSAGELILTRQSKALQDANARVKRLEARYDSAA